MEVLEKGKTTACEHRSFQWVDTFARAYELGLEKAEARDIAETHAHPLLASLVSSVTCDIDAISLDGNINGRIALHGNHHMKLAIIDDEPGGR